VLRWTYASERLVLYFQDQTGFSRFRLAPASRAEYQRVLMRMSQADGETPPRHLDRSARRDLLLASSSRAQTAAPPASYQADSLRLSGRPWHAAETLLAAARRDPNPNAFLIVEGAKAEVHAKRYEHARTLLAGQPWLLDYLDGEALALLGQAEYGVGHFADAATHFEMARARALAARVPLLAVRAGLAFDAAGQTDSAAAAFAAARAGESWPASTPGCACGRPASRGIRRLPTSSSPTCRHLPRATRRSRGRARCCWLAIPRVRSTLLSRAGKGEVSTPCVWLSRRAIRRAAGRCSTAVGAGSPQRRRRCRRELGAGRYPRAPREHVAMARALNRRSSLRDARIHLEHALRRGDSSAPRFFSMASSSCRRD